MDFGPVNVVEVVTSLRELGWQVATRGQLLREDLGRHCPDPLFRAWGHPEFSRARSLYGVAAGPDDQTLRTLRMMWNGGAKDIWVVGAQPGLLTWEVFADALRGAPAGHRLICARPEDLARGLVMAIVSREPEWVGLSNIFSERDDLHGVRGMGHSADFAYRQRGS